MNKPVAVIGYLTWGNVSQAVRPGEPAYSYISAVYLGWNSTRGVRFFCGRANCPVFVRIRRVYYVALILVGTISFLIFSLGKLCFIKMSMRVALFVGDVGTVIL